MPGVGLAIMEVPGDVKIEMPTAYSRVELLLDEVPELSLDDLVLVEASGAFVAPASLNPQRSGPSRVAISGLPPGSWRIVGFDDLAAVGFQGLLVPGSHATFSTRGGEDLLARLSAPSLDRP